MDQKYICHHYFINNVMSRMVRGIAEYFGNEFFDRSQEIVISTYEKAVQHFAQRLKEGGGEKHAPRYPFVVFDPGMDFEPDPQAGRFFHGYPNFQGAFAVRLIKPYIYEDDNMVIAPVLNRYKGRFELIVWCSSVYELMDFRMLAIQMFGGHERIIYPRNILGQIIIPDEILGFEYNNPYTQTTYNIDWDANKSEVNLIKNINQNKMIYPFDFRPWIKMTDISDGSEKYGGSGDELSEYRLNINLEWECSLPTHISLLATKEPIFDTIIEINLDVGFSSKCEFVDPITGKIVNTINLAKDTITHYVQNTEDPEYTYDWSYYKDKYKYTLSQMDVDSINRQDFGTVYFTLDKPIQKLNQVRVYSKYGPMKRNSQWNLTQNGTRIELVPVELENAFDAGDEIWVATYENV
jgi:hypothetical protein